MALSKTDSKIKTFAASLGIIQSMTWIILCMICIILYYSPKRFNLPSSYMETVEFIMYQIFLFTDMEFFPGQTFTGDVFNGFIWIHCFLNLTWLGVSIYLICKNTPKSFTAWSHCTYLLSFWDFITFVILGVDYSKCMDYAEQILDPAEHLSFQMICANGILVPFIVAAKGFTLWIFNIALASILYRTSKQLKTQVGSSF